MRYIAMLLLCACGLACNQKKKPHVLTEIEREMIKGIKESIKYFDTSTLPGKDAIQQFNRHIIDSIEHQ